MSTQPTAETVSTQADAATQAPDESPSATGLAHVPKIPNSNQGFWMGAALGIGAGLLLAAGVGIGMFVATSGQPQPIAPGSIELSRDQEVLLVDPMTRAPAREALVRWGHIAPTDEGASATAPEPRSEATEKASNDADLLAVGGDAAAAAALLEKARQNATSDAERTALGLQQALMLNTVGQAEQAKSVVDDIGRGAKDFGTQRAALGTLKSLE